MHHAYNQDNQSEGSDCKQCGSHSQHAQNTSARLRTTICRWSRWTAKGKQSRRWGESDPCSKISKFWATAAKICDQCWGSRSKDTEGRCQHSRHIPQHCLQGLWVRHQQVWKAKAQVPNCKGGNHFGSVESVAFHHNHLVAALIGQMCNIHHLLVGGFLWDFLQVEELQKAPHADREVDPFCTKGGAYRKAE